MAWDFQGPGGIGWNRKPSAEPVVTVTPGQTNPLWLVSGNPPDEGDPWPADPPILLTPPLPQFPQRADIEPIQPNDRNPVTGAPTRNLNLAPDAELPPGQPNMEPTGTHPITGAPNMIPAGTVDTVPSSYPWRFMEREETAPLPPLGQVPTVQGQVAEPEPPPAPPAPPPAP